MIKNSFKRRGKLISKNIRDHVDMYLMLTELEHYFLKNHPHGELHTKIYDLLNKIDGKEKED